MRLSKQEKEYIKKMANVLKDSEIADELTRIRIGFGIKERVNKRQVTGVRTRMGIRIRNRMRIRSHIRSRIRMRSKIRNRI